jgi:nucleoside 2-deoxyribosyltransferase
MKIYFAGSIRGGRDDKELYSQIINLLKGYGEVLTEHIGDPKLLAYGEVGVTDESIYERDVELIRGSDVIIAEVTNPSLGVGYELAYAESLGKKVICLYRETEDKRLSAMINGNKKLMVKNYKTVEDLPEILQEFF